MTSAQYSYRSTGEQPHWREAAEPVVAEGGSRAVSKRAAMAGPLATTMKEAAEASRTKDTRNCKCRSYGMSYYQVLGNPEFLDVHQNHTDCHCRAEDLSTQGPVKSGYAIGCHLP